MAAAGRIDPNRPVEVAKSFELQNEYHESCKTGQCRRPELVRLKCLRENPPVQDLVPKGRLRVAQHAVLGLEFLHFSGSQRFCKHAAPMLCNRALL